ncbi:MAG: hypothetical protein AB1918_16665, partial [Pseudomonadota bacterium]
GASSTPAPASPASRPPCAVAWMPVLPREMVTAGLMVIGPDQGLPELADTEIVLLRAPGRISKAAEMLAENLIRSLGTPLREDR